MCEETIVRNSDDRDTSFSDDCTKTNMISLSESRSDNAIDGESQTSEDWGELLDGRGGAVAFPSRTMKDEISIEIPCNTLLSIRNVADLSSNSSVGSSLSMDCDNDELHF
jgi:hypothetical protein